MEIPATHSAAPPIAVQIIISGFVNFTINMPTTTEGTAAVISVPINVPASIFRDESTAASAIIALNTNINENPATNTPNL